jgi:hypothetical protein
MKGIDVGAARCLEREMMKAYAVPIELGAGNLARSGADRERHLAVGPGRMLCRMIELPEAERLEYDRVERARTSHVVHREIYVFETEHLHSARSSRPTD